MKKIDLKSVNYKKVLQGSQKYIKEEKRDSMYRVATFLVDHFWYRSFGMSAGIGMLLLVWNQAYYRYCNFALDFEGLAKFLGDNEKTIKELRHRDISDFSEDADKNLIRKLFNNLLDVLKCEKRRSPVAVSKALHLLAPAFFPLWDGDISKAYGCYWYDSNQAWKKYLKFMTKAKNLSERIVVQYMDKNSLNREPAKESICKEASSNMPFTKSLLKIIDEYNYASTKY